MAIAPDEDDEDAIDVDAVKGDLVLALRHRALALLRLAEAGGAEAGSEDAEAVDEAIEALGRWTDLGANDLLGLRVETARLQARSGEALELLDAAIKARPRERTLRETRIAVLRGLGWDAWADEAETDLAVGFPAVGFRY